MRSRIIGIALLAVAACVACGTSRTAAPSTARSTERQPVAGRDSRRVVVQALPPAARDFIDGARRLARSPRDRNHADTVRTLRSLAVTLRQLPGAPPWVKWDGDSIDLAARSLETSDDSALGHAALIRRALNVAVEALDEVRPPEPRAAAHRDRLEAARNALARIGIWRPVLMQTDAINTAFARVADLLEVFEADVRGHRAARPDVGVR